MILRPPRSPRTDTLFPCTTLFRSDPATFLVQPGGQTRRDLRAVLRDQLPVQLDLAIRAVDVVVVLRGRHQRAKAELRAGAAGRLTLAFAGPGAGDDRQSGQVVVLDARRWRRRGAVGAAARGARSGVIVGRGGSGPAPPVGAETPPAGVFRGVDADAGAR